MRNSRAPRLETARAVLACAVPVALYLGEVLPRLRLPGMHLDEAFPVLPALVMLGHRVNQSVGYFLQLGPLSLPLSPYRYHGALDAYLAAPFIGVLGTTPEAVRLCVLSFGAATVVVFALIVRSLTSSLSLACVAATLLALHPTFVSATRTGMNQGSMLFFFELAALWSFLEWRRRGKEKYLFLGAFSLGCGMASRIWFVYCLPPFLLAGLILEYRAKRRLRKAALAALFFVLGAFPLAAHLAIDGNAVVPPRFHFAQTTAGADNSDYARNLAVRVEQARSYLTRDVFLLEQFPDYDRADFRVLGPLVGFSLVWLVFSLPMRRFHPSREKKAFFIFYILAYFLASPFTVSSHKTLHVLPLFPIFLIVVALALDDLRLGLDARWRPALLGFTAVVAGALDHSGQQACLETMAGVAPPYSEAIYEAADWVRERGFGRVVGLQWGLSHNLVYLTDGKTKVRSAWWDLREDEPKDYFGKLLADPGTVFLSYAKPGLWGDSRDLLLKAAAAKKVKIGGVRRFLSRDGTPAIIALLPSRPS